MRKYLLTVNVRDSVVYLLNYQYANSECGPMYYMFNVQTFRGSYICTYRHSDV